MLLLYTLYDSTYFFAGAFLAWPTKPVGLCERKKERKKTFSLREWVKKKEGKPGVHVLRHPLDQSMS